MKPRRRRILGTRRCYAVWTGPQGGVKEIVRLPGGDEGGRSKEGYFNGGAGKGGTIGVRGAMDVNVRRECSLSISGKVWTKKAPFLREYIRLKQ
jgi:hypothetical protein